MDRADSSGPPKKLNGHLVITIECRGQLLLAWSYAGKTKLGGQNYPASGVHMNYKDIHDLAEFVANLSIIFEVLINDTSRSHKLLQDETIYLKDVLL